MILPSPLSRVAALLAAGLGLVTAGLADPGTPPPAPERHSPLAPVEEVQGLPRVLLIGDSISIGYTLEVRERLKGQANVVRPPVNCGPTTTGLAQLEAWLETGGAGKRWDVIHFNWGLHDLKHVGEDGTTPVPAGAKGRVVEDVPLYNQLAAEVMKEAGIPTHDLYTFALERLDQIQRPADVHFTPEGSAVLADEVARVLLEVLHP